MTSPEGSRRAAPGTLDEFLSGWEASRPIFDTVREAIDSFGPTEIRVTRSQVGFWRRKAVARLWVPGRYLRGETAPLVLTLSFRYAHPSGRWKQIVEAYPGRFTHHLELDSAGDVDDEVRLWLKEAWTGAG